MHELTFLIEELLEKTCELLELCEAWNGSSGMDDASLERKNVKSKTVTMSPDDYIKKASRLVGHGYYKARKKHIKDLEQGRSLAKNDIEDYKEKISNPEKEIDVPYLRYDRGDSGQEGLHRAIAAKELGHKEIPVKIYYGAGKDENINRKFKKYGRAYIAKTKAEKIKVEKEKKQKDKEWEEHRAQIAKDREAHPEKYKRKEGQLDTSDILGPGW